MPDIIDRLRVKEINGTATLEEILAADTINMLRDKLTELEWQGGCDANDSPLCPSCQARKNDGHRENCELKSLI